MSALRKNILSLTVLQGANYLLPLVAIPYLLRVLGPDNFGRVAFAQAFIQYFVILADYGFNMTATRAIAKTDNNPSEISRIFNAVLATKFSIMSAGFVLMSVIVCLVPSMRDQYALFVVCYLAVVGNVIFPVWLYQGLQRMTYITVFTVAARALTVGLIFLLVTNREQYFLSAALMSAAMPLAGFGALLYAFCIAPIKLSLPSMRSMKQMLGDGWHVFTASLGGTLYNGSTIFALGLLTSPAIVGYFAAADKLLKAIQSFINPISQAVFPHVAKLFPQSGEQACLFVGRVLRIFMLGGVLVAFALYVGSDLISHILFGPQFTASAELIRLLSGWPLVISLNVVFGALLLVQLNWGKLLSLSILGPGLLHLALLYPVIRLAGAQGAAILMLTTEALILSIRFFGLLSKYRHETKLVLSEAFALRR